MSKWKSRLSILLAVLVMVSMTGTSVLAFDDAQAEPDPADAAAVQAQDEEIDADVLTEDVDAVEEGVPAEEELTLDEGEDPGVIEVAGGTISSETTTIADIEKQTYTGKAIEPDLTVTFTQEGETIQLNEGTDYSVTYKNNTNPGTATATVTGAGEYSGSVSANFTIAAEAPAAVKKLNALPGLGAIKLTWTKVDGANYYYIERRIAGKKKVDRTRITSAKETKSCSWENAYKIDSKKTYEYTIYAVKTVDGQDTAAQLQKRSGNDKLSKGTTAKTKTVQRMVITVTMKQTVGPLKAGKAYKTEGFGGGQFRIKYGKKTYHVSRLKTKNRKAAYNKNGKYSREAVEFFMNGGSTWAKGKAYSYVKKNKVKTSKKYLIWVNTYNQHVYLLQKKSGKWACIDDWKCSMGKKDTPSPTGHKKIVKKMRHRPGHGAPYWNFITWTSKGNTGTALHGIQPSARSSWIKSLGQLASHGCIRNPDEKAEWIMDHCKKGTTVIIF
ncbi:MAG: L,D-transpeptidase [Firmicutes bacterium]|nr:L,D-transpeptidase [Bacillota bacterium]